MIRNKANGAGTRTDQGLLESSGPQHDTMAPIRSGRYVDMTWALQHTSPQHTDIEHGAWCHPDQSTDCPAVPARVVLTSLVAITQTY